jgi:hypothetical protein
MIMEPSGHGVDDEVDIGETVATHDTTIAAVLADRTDLMLITIGGQAKPLWVLRWMAGGSVRFWSFARISSCEEYAR